MDDQAQLESWIKSLAAGKNADVARECTANLALRNRSAMANLIHATALAALGETASAETAFDVAVQIDPSLVVAQNNRANFLEKQGRFADALAGYDAAAALAPQTAAIHVNRGRMLGHLRRWKEAIEALGSATTLQPELPAAWLEQGVAFVAVGQLDDARSSFRRVLALAPRHEGAKIELIKLLLRSKRIEEALEQAESACSAHPTSSALHFWFAGVLRAAQRMPEALIELDRALQLDARNADAHAGRGQLLEMLARYEEAASAFEMALAIRPNHAEALVGMATALTALGRMEEAAVAADRALEGYPRSISALAARASINDKLNRSGEALRDIQLIVSLAPDDPRGWIKLASLNEARGAHSEANAGYERAAALDPDDATIGSAILWNLLHDPEADRDRVVAAHRAWGRRFGAGLGQQRRDASTRADPERPLRIGVVSGDLESHPVGRLLAAVLPSLDGAEFPLTCFSNNPSRDYVTDEIRHLTHGWHDVWSTSDQVLADLIRRERIDILLDLSGHTRRNRLGCFALAPAPVQATLWGYPFSTGLEAMDYAIMDDAAVPIGAEDMFVEEVLRMPGGRFRQRRPPFSLPVSMPPSVRKSSVTFGSFNNIAKLNDRVYETWAAILRRVPRSRLLLKWFNLADREVAASIRSTFQHLGITAERLELRPSSDYGQMLAEYADVDIALDPFPFSGGATSFDALWMGVPIVTLPSWQPGSRQTLGYLEALGRGQLAARNEADYVDIATRLAGDPSLLSAWRFSQRFAVENSSIGDFVGAAREIQILFRSMWRRATADRP